MRIVVFELSNMWERAPWINREYKFEGIFLLGFNEVY